MNQPRALPLRLRMSFPVGQNARPAADNGADGDSRSLPRQGHLHHETGAACRIRQTWRCESLGTRSDRASKLAVSIGFPLWRNPARHFSLGVTTSFDNVDVTEAFTGPVRPVLIFCFQSCTSSFSTWPAFLKRYRRTRPFVSAYCCNDDPPENT